jgi:hypothetical protein
MTVRGVAPPLEFAVHCQVADTLRRWATPDWMWTHVPLGERRSPVTGARLKRMGTQRGWPDFILIAPLDYYVLRPYFLELKRRGGKLSAPQAAFAAWCSVHHCPHAVADSYDTAVKVLQDWGAVRAGVHMQ